MKVKSFSHVRLFGAPRTAAYQAPPSMGFSRQESWSGVPLPSLETKVIYLKFLLTRFHHLLFPTDLSSTFKSCTHFHGYSWGLVFKCSYFPTEMINATPLKLHLLVYPVHFVYQSHSTLDPAHHQDPELMNSSSCLSTILLFPHHSP